MEIYAKIVDYAIESYHIFHSFIAQFSMCIPIPILRYVQTRKYQKKKLNIASS